VEVDYGEGDHASNASVMISETRFTVLLVLSGFTPLPVLINFIARVSANDSRGLRGVVLRPRPACTVLPQHCH